MELKFCVVWLKGLKWPCNAPPSKAKKNKGYLVKGTKVASLFAKQTHLIFLFPFVFPSLILYNNIGNLFHF